MPSVVLSSGPLKEDKTGWMPPHQPESATDTMWLTGQTKDRPISNGEWGTAGTVAANPTALPISERMSDSPANRRNNWPPENPSALSTANSWVRSRADMIMVLPSTSKMMPIMTNDMTFIAVITTATLTTGPPSR